MELAPICVDSLDPQAWDETHVTCSLNARIDGALVPYASRPGLRADEAHVLVLDHVVTPSLLAPLLEHVTGTPIIASGHMPPLHLWTRSTLDDANPSSKRTLGPVPAILNALPTLPASLELQSRLARLYPEYNFYWMPSDAMRDPTDDAPYHCSPVLVNAALATDSYHYHVDADPSCLPLTSIYSTTYGCHYNRDPDKPRFVSLLVYLNDAWEARWGGETMFLDTQSDVSVAIVPRPGRCVLFDQDVQHRVVPPSHEANRPRYSLVFKFIVIRKELRVVDAGIGARRFGPITAIGSAAKLRHVAKYSSRDIKTDEGETEKKEEGGES